MTSRLAKGYPGNIERRGSSYRVILYHQGVRRSFTVRTEDHADAVEFAKRKHSELISGGHRTFSSLLDEYRDTVVSRLTNPAYKQNRLALLCLFEEFFVNQMADPMLDRIGNPQIQRFVVWRRTLRVPGNNHTRVSSAPISNNTMRNTLGCLRHVFEYAEHIGAIRGNPLRRVGADGVVRGGRAVVAPGGSDFAMFYDAYEQTGTDLS